MMPARCLVKSVFLRCLAPPTRSLFPQLLTKGLSTSGVSFKKNINEDVEIEDYERQIIEEQEEDLLSEEKHNKFISEEGKSFFLTDRLPYIRNYNKVAVLLPWVKWGPKKRHNVSNKLLLEEACALITSMPSNEVVYKESVNLTRIVKNCIFTSGTMDRLVEEVNFIDCDAVFISLNYLQKKEIWTLEQIFRKRVFDRYMVVLDIFRYYASSAESKMQISAAEMPYVKRGIYTNEEKLWTASYNHDLKDKLEKLSKLREVMRMKRKNKSHDSIAVIGYTNCGKTTLIRGITNDKRLVGENRLFATLDVTSHSAILPCGLTSYFVDTVGFIQDIPINLVAAFRATLEDAIYADVIVYIRDLSHPDFACQHKTVQDTLEQMNIPESTPIIVVNSKCDLMDENEKEEVRLQYGLEGSYNVSPITGEGMCHLVRLIESKLLHVTGRKKLRLKLPIGSNKISWLKDNIGAQSEDVDAEDMNYARVVVAMNSTEISAYRKAFK